MLNVRVAGGNLNGLWLSLRMSLMLCVCVCCTFQQDVLDEIRD